MANRVEASAEEAIGRVASFSRSGEIAPQVYVVNHPVYTKESPYDKEWVEKGSLTGLTAVDKGATALAGDPAVKCIVLERNPHRVGLEKAVLLRIDSNNGKGISSWDVVYGSGEEPVIDEGRRNLVETVLGNIAVLEEQPLDVLSPKPKI